MPQTIKTLYDTGGQAITITLASLGSGSARECTAVDNTVNLYLDALVILRIKTGSGTIAGDKCAYVYAWGIVNTASPVYPDTVTGTDAAITLSSPTTLRLVAIIPTPAATSTYTSDPISIAAAFGGVLPAKWGVVVVNSTGLAFDATEGNFSKQYQGLWAQAV